MTDLELQSDDWDEWYRIQVRLLAKYLLDDPPTDDPLLLDVPLANSLPVSGTGTSRDDR